ncbi:hypothetical protein C0J52_23226, partial [Blattella germanica]
YIFLHRLAATGVSLVVPLLQVFEERTQCSVTSNLLLGKLVLPQHLFNIFIFNGGGGFTTGGTTNPFGQTFGKTTTTGFTTPAFGSTGSTLFGSTAPSAGGLFGAPAATSVFGQTTTTQSPAFGFPSSTTGSTLFGNQQNANTGLFGSSGASAFGGPNKPTFGGFASSTGTGLFGQQQQPQASQPTPSLFGQTAGTTSTGIFGSGEKITFLQSTSSQELTIATLSTACSSDNGSLMKARRDLILWFFNLLRAVLDEPGKCEALLSSRMFEKGAIWTALTNSSSCLCVETRRLPGIGCLADSPPLNRLIHLLAVELSTP